MLGLITLESTYIKKIKLISKQNNIKYIPNRNILKREIITENIKLLINK